VDTSVSKEHAASVFNLEGVVIKAVKSGEIFNVDGRNWKQTEFAF
jgi:hypothetical protein